MKGSDFVNIDNENVMIDKYEYEDIKQYVDLLNEDFAIKIYDGGTSMRLNKDTEISIYSYNRYNIQIDGKEYHIKSITLFNKIKKLINDNFDTLVLFSKIETKEFISKDILIGCSRNITIKYGQLLININGAINGNVGNFCKEFIDEIKKLIINEGEKTQEDYMMKLFEKNEPQPPTPLDEEFDKYCKLYEEKFGNKVTIPEPSGTKEFVIECIKKCLQENKDILGDLCYPNFKKDMENGVLYSETINDLIIDKLDTKTNDENLKTIVNEVISNNQEMIGNDTQYCNTIVYDIVKKIIDLPNETTITIADLINYNPNEKFVEPIKQGKITRLVKEICKNLNIKLEDNRDKFGGLAYYNEFKKVNNEKDTNNGVLHSGTEQDLRSDVRYDDRKTIDFLCNNCGTSTSMSFRRKFTTGNKVYARCNNCGNQLSADNPFNESTPNLNNDKFVWKEGEIKIAKTQCEFCKHNDNDHPNVCSQYPNGKPNEVINNSIKCPKFEKKNRIDL